MDYLWSPWRMEYIESAKDEASTDGCIFCDLPAAGDDEKSLILARSGLSFALLNRFPYNPGHVLIAPLRHIGDIASITDDEALDMHRLLQGARRALEEEMAPHGFNVGMNLGRTAGAGIPDHLHWHVVPRWNGDSNFMPVIGQTKVLPELLAETWTRLTPRF